MNSFQKKKIERHIRKERNKNQKKKRELQKKRELEKIENALLEQTSKIINELMSIIKNNIQNQTIDDEPNNYSEKYNNITEQIPETQNVSMNIQRDRIRQTSNNDQSNIVLRDGSQFYPGTYNPMTSSRRNANPLRRQDINYQQPAVTNRIPTTVGPGGRREAPRDNVIMGNQALSLGANIARNINRNRNNNVQTSASSNRQRVMTPSQLQNTSRMRAPTRSVGPTVMSRQVRQSSLGPSRAPVARARSSNPGSVAALAA